MNQNKILTFYQAVAASTTLQKKLTSALDLPEENQKMEAVLALAKEAGCPFTASEWQQAVAALGDYSDTKPSSGEQPEVPVLTLTDSEMEERRQVFGGRLMVHQNEVCSHYRRGGNLFTYAACCASCKYEQEKECLFGAQKESFS